VHAADRYGSNYLYIDYLNRKVGLTLEEIAGVVAAPFWQVIDNMPEEQKEKIHLS